MSISALSSASGNGSERRRSPRFPVRCEALIVRNGSWTARGTLAEFSLCGLRLSGVALGCEGDPWIPTCVDPAARLFVSFNQPGGRPVHLLGRVVWSEGHQAGVTYVSMTTESRVRLWDMITVLGRQARGHA